MKKVILKLISKNQGGFIAGRHIYDNILMVQEAIHTSQNHKEAGMEIKLDLTNSFDRTRHSFIFQVMQNYGFLEAFIWWVRNV